MNYDSLYSVSKAIAEKMGADGNKKYDSTYSVALEILNRMDSNASKLKSVNEFPTDNVKDGDVVYLKGNTDNADGFYVYSDGGWTMISGGSSTMKTYTFQTLVDGGTAGLSESDRASMLQSVKNGENFRIDIANAGYSFLAFGFYHTDTRAVVYFGFADTNSRYYRYSTDDDKVSFYDTDSMERQLAQVIEKLGNIEKKMGAVKVDTLPNVESADDILYIKRDDDGYEKIYSKYAVSPQFESPISTSTDYKKIIITLSNDDWANYYNGGGNYVALFVMVPEITIDGNCNINIMIQVDASGNKTITPKIREDYTKYFSLVKISDDYYEYRNLYSNNILVGYLTIDNENHSFIFNAEGDYHFMLNGDTNQKLSIDGTETTLDLTRSTGYTIFSEDKMIQAAPHIDTGGNIYENGKKLSEKYNPYNTTDAKSAKKYDTYYIPNWNSNGQITGSETFYIGNLTLNGVRLGCYIYTGVGAVRDWYAPTTSGTSGQVLQSNGNAAPTWTDLIKIQKITQDVYDALETKDSNVLYVITDETA